MEQTYFAYLSNLIKHNDSFAIKSLETYLEIGVCDGFSIQSIIREFPDLRKAVLSDTWGDEYGGSNKGSHDHIVQLLIEEGYSLNKVTFLDGDSKITIPEYFDDSDEIFDLLYVDGDHSIYGCLADVKNCIEHCKVMAVHDIRHPQYLFIRDLMYAFYQTINDRFYMVDNGEYIIYFIKKDLFL